MSFLVPPPIAVYGFNFTVASSTRMPTSQGKSTSVHNIDRFSDRAQHMMGLGLREGWRSDDQTAGFANCQKRENHESSQARGNQSFRTDSADRTTNEKGLIGQRVNIELRWNRGLALGSSALIRAMTVHVGRVACFWMVPANTEPLSLTAARYRLRGKAITHQATFFDVDRISANRLDRDSV